MGTPVRDNGKGYAEIVDDGRAFKTLAATFLHSAMTDSTTTATYTFPTLLPAGAIVLGWSYKTLVAFTGDTSATVQVGIAGTLAAFSQTTTGSCFTAINGSSACPVATSMQAAAIAPRVTITSATAASGMAAGASMTVTVFYLDPINQ